MVTKKKILIAPNAFKNSLTAIDVAKAINEAISEMDLKFECVLLPIADGGDSTIDILNFSCQHSKFINSEVFDPLMRKITSKWLLIDEAAFIELAKASGLALLNRSELNPMIVSTFGTGQLISSALNYGVKELVIALGGSATVDAGVGILNALGVNFFNQDGDLVEPCGGNLCNIKQIDLSNLDLRLKKVSIKVLCDVEIPLMGKKGTVNLFSGQKGATEEIKKFLEEGMQQYSETVKEKIGEDFSSNPMVGSAGGVAFSLKALLGSKLLNGFEYISSFLDLDNKIQDSNLIITGEGKLDYLSSLGKGSLELIKLAKKYKKPVIVICGSYDENINWKQYGINHIIAIKSKGLSLEESIKDASNLIKKSIRNNCQIFINC